MCSIIRSAKFAHETANKQGRNKCLILSTKARNSAASCALEREKSQERRVRIGRRHGTPCGAR